jgi:hypothetical protein
MLPKRCARIVFANWCSLSREAASRRVRVPSSAPVENTPRGAEGRERHQPRPPAHTNAPRHATPDPPPPHTQTTHPAGALIRGAETKQRRQAMSLA